MSENGYDFHGMAGLDAMFVRKDVPAKIEELAATKGKKKKKSKKQ